MKYNILCTVLLYLMAFSAEAATKINDNLLIPGERVGFITKTSTEDDLVRLLPKNKPKRILYDTGEGEYRCASEIFANSEKAAVVIWGSDKNIYEPYKEDSDAQKKCDAKADLASPRMVIINNLKGYWRTENNIKTGMDLLQLEKAFAQPVKFSICECHNGGKIIEPDSANLEIHLNYSNNLQSILEHNISGENQVVSSADILDKVRSSIRIDNITIYFDEVKP